MNRMTDNDRNYGPFAIARWRKRIAIEIESGGEEDPQNFIRLMAFGWALRYLLPQWTRWIIRPYREKVIAKSWDKASIKWMGRNWYYRTFPRQYGIALSDMGNGYDFLQVFFGAQTNDSITTMDWCKHLPWKQWPCVRWSIYTPDGYLYATEPKGEYFEFYKKRERCPKSHFTFRDHDGEMIVATCMVEERELRKGEGWFKWLRWFSSPLIRKSLDIQFSAETGPGKGSWTGGAVGHGIDMKDGEMPQKAFERYCAKEHSSREGMYRIRFIGPCGAPAAKSKFGGLADTGSVDKAHLR